MDDETNDEMNDGTDGWKPCLMHRCVISTMFGSCFSFFIKLLPPSFQGLDLHGRPDGWTEGRRDGFRGSFISSGRLLQYTSLNPVHNAQVCVFDDTCYTMMLNDIGVTVTYFCKISFPVKHLMPYYTESGCSRP